ncbi:D-tyrosyl-tRNA(Tyr) deacylase [bacterium]|nr:D-tyrosyl-tRNA(Tyr) deacylase [bacterium]
MKALIQRVKHASVTIDGKLYSKIGAGLLVFLGVEKGDTEENAKLLSNKLANLRIFEDENEKMNKSITDVNGEMLVVSQFTLCGDCRKGTRPSFDKSAPPDIAENLYEKFTALIKELNIPVKTGKFRAMMDVELLNDGPVTFLVEK